MHTFTGFKITFIFYFLSNFQSVNVQGPLFILKIPWGRKQWLFTIFKIICYALQLIFYCIYYKSTIEGCIRFNFWASFHIPAHQYGINIDFKYKNLPNTYKIWFKTYFFSVAVLQTGFGGPCSAAEASLDPTLGIYGRSESG